MFQKIGFLSFGFDMDNMKGVELEIQNRSFRSNTRVWCYSLSENRNWREVYSYCQSDELRCNISLSLNQLMIQLVISHRSYQPIPQSNCLSTTTITLSLCPPPCLSSPPCLSIYLSPPPIPPSLSIFKIMAGSACLSHHLSIY